MKPNGNIKCVCYTIPNLHLHLSAVILVKSGRDTTARTERDGASCAQKIFHQKNTCGYSKVSKSEFSDWIPAGVYPREYGGRNDKYEKVN